MVFQLTGSIATIFYFWTRPRNPEDIVISSIRMLSLFRTGFDVTLDNHDLCQVVFSSVCCYYTKKSTSTKIYKMGNKMTQGICPGFLR